MPGTWPSLCERCAHVKAVETPRGSRFLLCLRSQSEPRYPKYPPQPVVSCVGFAAVVPSEERSR